VEVLRNDLGSSSEYVSDITLEGKSLGSCNPDGDDYDCTFYRCSNTGTVTGPSDGKFDVNMKFVGHSYDCDCDKKTWACSKERTIWGRSPMTAVYKFIFTPILTAVPAPAPAAKVSCGGHEAGSCAECPGIHGAAWCNGDCYWSEGSCIKPETINWIIYTEGTTPRTDNIGEIPGAIPGLQYDVNVEVLRNDLGSSSEYVSDITLEGKSLGSCNPDGDDYDCTFYRCSNTGTVTGPSDGKFDVNMKFVGHSYDCDCDKKTWACSKEKTVGGRSPMTAVYKFIFTPK